MFGYTGDFLASVTDSAGHSVTYTYTGNDLTIKTRLTLSMPMVFCLDLNN